MLPGANSSDNLRITRISFAKSSISVNVDPYAIAPVSDETAATAQ